jgi:predicted dehydrogenase
MAYRVGVIGCGRMASTIEDEVQGVRRGGMVLPYCHAGGFASFEGTEMVAACDIDEEKRTTFMQRWNVPRGYTDYKALIDTEKPDILSICTRPEQHAEAMIYGAAHGVKGMYAEKPLCCTLNEADAISDAFEKNGVFLEFGPMRRNWAVYRQARELTTSGTYGKLKSVVGYGGNSVGGHFLDTLLYLLGDPDPISIRGTLDQLYLGEGKPAGMWFVKDTPIRSAMVDFENGLTLFAAGTGQNGEYELVCEEGIIRTQNDGESLHVRQATETGKRTLDTVKVEPVAHWSGTVKKIEELAQAISTGKPGVSNLRSTMIGTEIGFGLYESHLNGGIEVSLPVPNRDRFVSSW